MRYLFPGLQNVLNECGKAMWEVCLVLEMFLGYFVKGLCGIFCTWCWWKICVDCFVQGGKSVLTVLCSVVNLCWLFCAVW